MVGTGPKRVGQTWETGRDMGNMDTGTEGMVADMGDMDTGREGRGADMGDMKEQVPREQCRSTRDMWIGAGTWGDTAVMGSRTGR